MPNRLSNPPPRRGRTPAKPGAVTVQVQSLTRGLSLLEALARAEGGLTLTDVAQRVQLAPSTAHRLLSTLEKMGYVYQAGDLGRWYVGLQAFTVGTSFLANRDFIAQSHPYMRRLMEQSGETANLGILDGTEAVFIDQVQCREMMRTIVKLGSRVPLHASGVGKAIFAALPDDEIEAILKVKGLPRITGNTITSPETMWASDSRDPPARLVVRRRGARAGDALRGRAHLQRACRGARRDLARRDRRRDCPTSASSSWVRSSRTRRRTSRIASAAGGRTAGSDASRTSRSGSSLHRERLAARPQCSTILPCSSKRKMSIPAQCLLASVGHDLVAVQHHEVAFRDQALERHRFPADIRAPCARSTATNASLPSATCGLCCV